MTAAPATTRVARQAGFEARIILGNGEQLMLAFVLPVLAIVSVVHLTWIPLQVPAGHHRIDVAAPGVLAVAILSTAFTGQAIATAFDRRNGVLRLLGTTPLGRGGLLAARFLAVLGVVVVQALVLVGLARALGWAPEPSGLLPAAVVALVGSYTFLALGLLLGGTMRAEGVLAVANLVWVLLTGLGGVLLPVSGPFAAVVAVMPSGALGNGLRTSLLTGTWPVTEIVVQLVWAVLLTAATRRFFRWW